MFTYGYTNCVFDISHSCGYLNHHHLTPLEWLRCLHFGATVSTVQHKATSLGKTREPWLYSCFPVPLPWPPLGRSDHNLANLTPAYILMVNKKHSPRRCPSVWPEGQFQRWDLCKAEGCHIDSLRTSIINLCVENCAYWEGTTFHPTTELKAPAKWEEEWF